MSNYCLEIPNMRHKVEYERVMDKWESMENNIQPELMRRYSKNLGSNIPFDKWLEYCEDDRTTGSMLKNNVPCTLFFMIKDKKEIVGCIVMNHKDTHRGHLHAGIVPWHRGKGYGTKMLSLALQKCFDAGIPTVHITPRKDNQGAIKTILKNGGVLIQEFVEDGNQILRYEIDITTSVKN